MPVDLLVPVSGNPESDAFLPNEYPYTEITLLGLFSTVGLGFSLYCVVKYRKIISRYFASVFNYFVQGNDLSRIDVLLRESYRDGSIRETSVSLMDLHPMSTDVITEDDSELQQVVTLP